MNPLIVQAVLYGAKVARENIPTLTKGMSRLVFDFVKDSSDNRSNSGKQIALSKKIDIVENDLSVPRNFLEKQIVRISQDITDDLSIIKGQNEILFLSNSIDYFLKAHSERTGIDRGISHALQCDVAAVRNHISNNQQLRFPGYLLHQCTALASTIEEYNLFYDSILNDGHVREWTRESANEELDRTFGPFNEPNPVAPYIPHQHKLSWIREQAKRKHSDSGWLKKLPFFAPNEKLLDEAHDALDILSKELVTSEALEVRILERLSYLPKNRITILPSSSEQ